LIQINNGDEYAGAIYCRISSIRCCSLSLGHPESRLRNFQAAALRISRERIALFLHQAVIGITLRGCRILARAAPFPVSWFAVTAARAACAFAVSVFSCAFASPLRRPSGQPIAAAAPRAKRKWYWAVDVAEAQSSTIALEG
jgi:hypothetical protein